MKTARYRPVVVLEGYTLHNYKVVTENLGMLKMQLCTLLANKSSSG